MSSFDAIWFDGSTSRAHAVAIERADAHSLRMRGDGIDRSERLAVLRITPRLARTARVIEFPDGGRLHVADDALLDTWFPSEDGLQSLVDRLERHAHAVAASIFICIATAFAAFTWGVPWAADRIADQMPASVESALGEEVLGQLDRVFGFKPSQLDETRRDVLQTRFARIVDGIDGASAWRLEFRHAESIGANALALPGGTIVVTDELVELVEDDREFDAIVAHELGHQAHRHSLRQALRSSFVVVIAAMLAGDVSSASAVVVAVPTFLLQSHYSRGFEEEADRFAFERLAALGESPAWFAEAMRRIADESDYDDDLAYLSSHPSTTERIVAAEQAGERFLAAHPDRAKDSPGYDACAEEGICPEDDEDDGCDYDCWFEACLEMYDGDEDEFDACMEGYGGEDEDEDEDADSCEPATADG